MKMKQFKLLVHQKNFSEESLLINSKDWPQVQVGDILEIYLLEDEYSRLLLQVSRLQEDFTPKDTISIEQSITSSFHLRAYAEVVVNKVSPKDVALDSVELFFKDQYLSRSDMWRLKQSLINTCVYSNKKIENFGIRCQVLEMWSQGERVACGVLMEDTKIVYRSASSMVYLFIQMSSEMWDFDINGDLYFEKAVNGFLADLFAKWKKLNCNHDVTIVLFSRTFYEAVNIDEFPAYMRECLQRDYKGRFFEDFYRVAVQNERYDDWSGTLILLKNIFNQYSQLVLEQHKSPGVNVPRALNATSSQGNFLEVLNMSLNVFEKHYMDRSFDRTGQLSVVISPGVGVFEVDRDLTNVTKQRIIDNGIGSDLVCLGEQPLHAVPLFKFHNKQRSNTPLTDGDNYNMPHWINLSFYCSTKHINYSNFVPRIKLPTRFPKSQQGKISDSHGSNRARHASQPEHTFPSVFDYEDYDAQVFQLPSYAVGSKSTHSLQRSANRRKSAMLGNRPSNHQQKPQRTRSNRCKEEEFLVNSEPGLPSSSCHMVVGSLPPARSLLGPSLSSSRFLAHLPLPHARSGAISIPQQPHQISSSTMEPMSGTSFIILSSGGDERENHEMGETELTPPSSRAIVGSAGSPYEHPVSKQLLNHRPRALINPFDPSHVTIKLTSNRRRWTHVFPLGPTGIFMQQHHYQAVPQNTAATLLPPHLDHGCHDLSQIMAEAQLISAQAESTNSGAIQEPSRLFPTVTAKPTPSLRSSPSTASLLSNNTNNNIDNHNRSCRAASSLPSADPQTDRNLSWLWGATGEQEWTSALTTGVDWKSLVIPACLPITTDYFPDKRSLQLDYLVVSDYTLLPEDIGIDLAQLKCYRGEEESQSMHQPPSTLQVFRELVYQRLQQGFQVVILPKEQPGIHGSNGLAPSVARGTSKTEAQEVYLMSIGRIYHKITSEGSAITVTQFRPRHPYQTVKIHYCYRFRAPDNESYGISWVDFVSEKLENYNWNHLDNYVCQRGIGEFELKEALKFWRLRLLLLPSSGQATKRIADGLSEHCDIYQESGWEEHTQQRDAFLRFLEILNRIRRTPNKRIKMSSAGSVVGQPLVASAVMRLQQQPILQGLRRFSLGTGSLSSSVQTQTSQSALQQQQQQQHSGDRVFRERMGSTGNRPMPTGQRPITSSKAALDRVKASAAAEVAISGRISPATSDLGSENKLSGSNTSLEGNVENENEHDKVFPEIKRLSMTSSHREIVEAMKHPEEGLSFVRQAGLPTWTFFSSEAISWMQEHLEGIREPSHALTLLQKFKDEDLVKHASGLYRQFLPGFFLYAFVSDKDSDSDLGDNLEDSLEMFQREWMEVEVGDSTSSLLDSEDSYCEFQDPETHTRLPSYQNSAGDLGFRICTMNFAGVSRSEWGQLRYQSRFQPGAAYELILEWMVASANIVAELVLGWARKATGLGFHLVPIPRDPFALPFSSKSDPLRGPIFIPLRLEALTTTAGHFTDESLYTLQKQILYRFGFIFQTDPNNLGPSQSPNRSNPQQQRQYVHVSGSFFIIVLPDMPQSSHKAVHPNLKTEQIKEDLQFLCSPHEKYITRHFSGVKTSNTWVSTSDQKVGFLWSWNYMITKRWKTQSTGDDHFIHKVLHDFKSFCANKDNRLLQFWENHIISFVPDPDPLPSINSLTFPE